MTFMDKQEMHFAAVDERNGGSMRVGDRFVADGKNNGPNIGSR